MTTTFSTTAFSATTRTKRHLSSLFGRYRDGVQEWRRRGRLRADLCALDDRELQDIGIARGEVDHVVSSRSADPRGVPAERCRRIVARAMIVAVLCNACILAFASEARAQCAAQDVLHHRLMHKEAAPAGKLRNPIASAVDVPVWKTIAIGTFPDWFALRRALTAAGCSIGETAEEILARPAFSLSTARAEVELLAVSAAELGFDGETVSLGEIYARAQQLGFRLAPAEIGPQLRLQYFDQPIGEFLIIGMEPIKTWEGEPVILTVANGGAGLLLVGQDGRADAEIFTGSRFLFARANKVKPSQAAVVHH